MSAPNPAEPTPGGVWVSYYDDHSGAYAHETEVDALRSALPFGRQVHFVPFGRSVFDPERDA